MDTTRRSSASLWRGLASALLFGDPRDEDRHPPDLHRRTLLYGRFLR